ncbi:hypothetical protein Cni_G06236 [Canna indica]|uniref:CASP-like protein n=1 Tax=Canna indica TaxID=4628 RepID=A0AAQ3JY54_9LILI|nr:hypothetical protein Cni_G06236 [Canna indica]
MASSKGAQFAALALRIFVFFFSLVALIILATTTVTVPDPESETGKSKLRFKDVLAYRYLFSVAIIGCAYALIQIPISALSITKGKKIISRKALRLYIFADLVFALLLASGAGAGFGLTVDLKRAFNKVFKAAGLQDDPLVTDVNKALNLVHASTGCILMAAVCMAFVVLISTSALAKK